MLGLSGTTAGASMLSSLANNLMAQIADKTLASAQCEVARSCNYFITTFGEMQLLWAQVFVHERKQF